MSKSPEISIITATYLRPKWLQMCCEQIKAQLTGGLSFEHVIVSDGSDPRACQIARSYGATFYAAKKRRGCYGAACKDMGIRLAKGKYVVFFDDDNLYYPHALTTLFSAAQGVDIGICQTLHKGCAIPNLAKSPFKHANIDSMCFCIERAFAHRSRWRAAKKSTDWAYLRGLLEFEPTYRVSPVVIGAHLV
ncbi:glycosyltransferase [bacterium]|nr:glycosyltransferase [bacterium]